jgi:hypothetical protein
VVVVAVAVVIAFAVISAGLDLIAMLVGVVLGVMFLPVVALVAADVACFASAAANLVLIEVDAANLFSNPCSVSVASRDRVTINERVAQQQPPPQQPPPQQPRPPPTTPYTCAQLVRTSHTK